MLSSAPSSADWRWLTDTGCSNRRGRGGLTGWPRTNLKGALTLLRHTHSLLFLPASNACAIANARTLPYELVILDLEDAVPDDRKEEARSAQSKR
jgi:hypothetical protein